MKMFLCSLLMLGGVVLAPGAAQAQRVRVPPPPGHVELVPQAPTPQHVWVRGSYQWDGGQYQWVPGRYEVPPQPGQVWIPARWTPKGRTWVHHPGYWTMGARPAFVAVAPAVAEPAYGVPSPPPAEIPVGEIVATQAPPPPAVEVIPAAPSPAHVWVSGHWLWQGGRYVWQPGHHELRRVGYRYEPARWNQWGRHWRYVPGRWRTE